MKVCAALVTGVAACAALWVSANAQNQSPPASASAQRNESIRVDPQADAPWSDERMRNATEMKPPLIDLPALRLTPPPPAAPPIPPVSGRFANPTDLADGKLLPSERSGDPSTYPLRWAGRLFAQMTIQGRLNDITCSAQFIASNMIVTAAHCVRDSDTGAWGRNFQFALQYDRGRYSKTYRQTCLGTKPDAYASRPDDVAWRSRDYALLLSDEPSQTGHFGWQLDWRGSYPEATAIGYPVGLEKGNVVQVVTGPLFFPNELAGMVVMQEPTKGFADGASGGAFVGNFRSDGGNVGNRVISVLSARNRESPLLLGPYFDDGFKSLYEYVARGCR